MPFLTKISAYGVAKHVAFYEPFVFAPMFTGVSEFTSPALRAGGRRFEPCAAHHFLSTQDSFSARLYRCACP